MSGLGFSAAAQTPKPAVLPKIKVRRKGVFIPAQLPKWDKSVDGLESPARWAADFERSLLPHGTILPREGQIWEAIEDCEVAFAASFTMDVTSLLPTVLPFGTARLKRGEQIRILPVNDQAPVHVSFVPVRYKELEESIVPEELRDQPGYAGYWLSAKTARTIADFQPGFDPGFLNEQFKLIQEAPPEKAPPEPIGLSLA